jgi:hypothetical protein
MVMSPPVFLSEEEALQIIKEEFAKAGFKLGKGMLLDEVTVEYADPSVRWLRSGDNWLGEKKTTTVSVDLAAVDPDRGVGVEVITGSDCRRARSFGVISTVQSFDTIGLAKCIAEGIREQGQRDLRIGVFYDPLEKRRFDGASRSSDESDDNQNFRDRNKGIVESSRERSETQLRKQARDFIAWLKKH